MSDSSNSSIAVIVAYAVRGADLVASAAVARVPTAALPAGASDADAAADALTAAGIDATDARVSIVTSGPDVGAAVVQACDVLARGGVDLVAVVGWSPAAADGRRASATVVLASADSTRDGAPDALARVRIALARDPAPSDPHERFPMLAEACARVGVSPRAVTLCDAHATTPARAAAMLSAVEFAVSRGSNEAPHCAVGPVCGSVNAFDAVTALAAHVDALAAHVLPTLGTPVALPPPFCADDRPRPWIDSWPRRSAIWTDATEGVSVVLLEEATTSPDSARLLQRGAIWRHDLALLSADSRRDLATELRSLAEQAAAMPGASVAHLSAPFVTRAPARFRAAIVATDARDLATRAARLATAITDSDRATYQTPDGLFFADAESQSGKTAFVFPGQGSQYVGMFRELCLDMPRVQHWFEGLQDSMLDDDTCSTGMLVAPPRQGLSDQHRDAFGRAVAGLGSGALLTMTSSLALCEQLRLAGVTADAVAGYSNGENAALIAANAHADRETTFAFMRMIRLHDQNDAGHVRGAALAVNRARASAIADVIAHAGGRLTVALDNCPEQVVLFGDPDAVAEAATTLTASGATCLRLAFEHGHHTPAFAGRARHLRAIYADVAVRQTIPIYSCATADVFPEDLEAARDLAADQWCRPVRFTETIERLYADGVRCFVEVGPGSTLTGFVRSTLRGRPHVVMPSNIQGRSDLEQLLHVLGRLFVHGHPIDMNAVRPRTAPGPARVLVRPPTAESATVTPAPRPSAVAASTSAPRATTAPSASMTPATPLQQHMAMMQEFLHSQQRTFLQLTDALRHPGATAGASTPLTTTPLPAAPLAATPSVADTTDMLGHVVVHTAERLEARRRLDRQIDAFLWHHSIGARLTDRGLPHSGVPVVPFSVSLEIIVEAAAKFAGWSGGAFTLENVRASKWIIVDRDDVTLVITATWEPGAESTAVRVRVSDAAATGRPAFEGIVRHGAAPAVAMALAPAGRPTLTREVFTDMLFHGPLFVSIDRMLGVDANSVRVECVVPPDTGWFSDGRPLRDLVSCGLLDAVSQLVGLWLGEHGRRFFGLFPFEWRRFTQFAPPPAAGTRVVMQGRVEESGGLTSADVEILSVPDGAVIARVEGLRGKALNFPQPFYDDFFAHTDRSRVTVEHEGGRRLAVLPHELFGDRSGIWLRVLARQALTDHELALWNTLPEGERATWLRQRVVAKEVALDAFAASRGRGYRGRDVEARPIDGGFAVVAPDGAIVEAEITDSSTTTDGRLRASSATALTLQVPSERHRETL